MEPEENIAVLRRAVDLINNGELEGGARLVTDSFKRHDLAAALPATQGGSGEVMDFLGTLVTAMPDLHFAFEDVFGAGDKVTARYLVTGTHQGQLFGVEPTNAEISFSAINIYRFEDGKFAEVWQLWDWAAVYRQLGILGA